MNIMYQWLVLEAILVVGPNMRAQHAFPKGVVLYVNIMLMLLSTYADFPAF